VVEVEETIPVLTGMIYSSWTLLKNCLLLRCSRSAAALAAFVNSVIAKFGLNRRRRRRRFTSREGLIFAEGDAED
jgi:hypothetical protein